MTSCAKTLSSPPSRPLGDVTPGQPITPMMSISRVRDADARGDGALRTSTLNVLVLLLEGNIALCILQLAHDLDGLALGLAHVEAECVGAGPD